MPSLNTGNAILSNAITVDGSYNVGIGGAVDASYKLKVTGASLLTGDLTLNNGNADGAQLVLTSSGYSNWNLDNYSGSFRAYYNASVAMTITSGLNVGIGTSSPNSRLHVAADGAYSSNWDAAQLWVTGTDTAKRLQVGYDTTNGYGILQAIHGGVSVKPLLLNPQGGNVLIGTTTIANGHKLEIIAGSQSALRIDVTSGYSGLSMSPGAIFGIDKPGVGGGTFRIGSDGAVNINSATSPYNSRVFINTDISVENGLLIKTGTDSGSYGYVRFVNASNQNIGGIFQASTTTLNYATSSDYRLKEDLKDFNGLDKISSIKVYDFKWKESENRMEGVLAHELQEVIPYAVNGEKDAMEEDGTIRTQGVDYSKLVPILIKSVQELNQTIQNQQQQINQLINK